MAGGYCASKYALEALANAQRMELRSSGVALSLIEPGVIRSNLRSNAMKNLQNKLSTKDHFHSEYKQTPKKQTASNHQAGQRMQSPEIVARKGSPRNRRQPAKEKIFCDQRGTTWRNS